MPPHDPTEGFSEDQDGYVRAPNRQARIAAFAVFGLLLAIIPIALIGSFREAKGDPWNLSEDLYAVPPDLAPLQLTEATVDWGPMVEPTRRSHI